jgi:hypothetical protein
LSVGDFACLPGYKNVLQQQIFHREGSVSFKYCLV